MNCNDNCPLVSVFKPISGDDLQAQPYCGLLALKMFHWPNGCEMYFVKMRSQGLIRPQYANNKRGFTLTELMVTVAIAAILLTIAVPQFRRQIEQSQFTNTSNELLGVMNYARAEALRRSRPVTVAPLVGTSWDSGWQMFLDVNRNGALDGAAVLRQGGAITAAQLTTTATFVTFDSNGRRWSGGAAPFIQIEAFKTGAAADLKRTVCIASSGRSAIAKGALACG